MVTLLRFAAAFALPPGVFVAAAAVLTFLLLGRGRRRPALVAGLFALLLYLASARWLGVALVHRLEYGYAASRPSAQAADVIVVLGEGAAPGTPGLFGRGSPSGSTARGLLAALALHRRTGLPILLSGGRGDSTAGNESRIGRRILLALGVPAADLAVDARSRTTLENARDTAALMRRHGWCGALLVASALHMVTARRDFAWYGVPVRPEPSGYATPRRLRLGLYDLAPTAGGLSMTAIALEQDAELALADLRPLLQRRPAGLSGSCGRRRGTAGAGRVRRPS